MLPTRFQPRQAITGQWPATASEEIWSESKIKGHVDGLPACLFHDLPHDGRDCVTQNSRRLSPRTARRSRSRSRTPASAAGPRSWPAVYCPHGTLLSECRIFAAASPRSRACRTVGSPTPTEAWLRDGPALVRVRYWQNSPAGTSGQDTMLDCMPTPSPVRP